MRAIFVLLLAVSSAIAFAVNSENEESARDKRHLVFLVPPPPQHIQQLFVPVEPSCGAPSFTCQGACVSNDVGIPAVKGEYPWLVQLYSGGRFICGGSIIDNNYILTSASCIDPATPTSVAALRVHLGDFKQNSLEDGQFIERNVSVIYRHADYVPSRKIAAVNDIALLKLSTPVIFTEYIKPICLDDGSQRVDNGFTEGILAGYGILSYSTRPPTNDLYKVNVRITTTQECQNSYSAQGVQLTDNQICAGTHTVPSFDPCVGDNGGPLFIKYGPNAYRQVGINSFGLKCGTGGPPAAFTRISKFKIWIDQVRLQKMQVQSYATFA